MKIFRKKDFSEKRFSVKAINKYDLFKIFGKSVSSGIGGGYVAKSKSTGISMAVMGLLLGSIEKLSNDEAARLDMPTKRSNFGNPYLADTLKRLHYVENYDYMVGEKDSEVNISLSSGRFIITVPKKTDAEKKIDKGVWEKMKSVITRTDTGQVIIYSYVINSKSEFDLLIKKLMSVKVEPNIFEK